MELPTKHYRPDREWQGQKFCHHRQENAVWTPWRLPGFEHRNTGVDVCTRNMAGVKVVRPSGGSTPSTKSSHTADIYFSFCMAGTAKVDIEGDSTHCLRKGTAVTLPPNLPHCWKDVSPDFE